MIQQWCFTVSVLFRTGEMAEKMRLDNEKSIFGQNFYLINVSVSPNFGTHKNKWLYFVESKNLKGWAQNRGLFNCKYLIFQTWIGHSISRWIMPKTWEIALSISVTVLQYHIYYISYIWMHWNRSNSPILKSLTFFEILEKKFHTAVEFWVNWLAEFSFCSFLLITHAIPHIFRV